MKAKTRQWLTLMLAALMVLGSVAPLAQADGTVIVGEVTVISRSSINIRSGGSTEYPVIATASSGELFQTTGQVATGWYEILLPNDVLGYVSNNLVYFYAYPNPIPLGNPQYTIQVQYMTPQGQVLKTVQVPVSVGQNVITADDSQVPGYRLTSTRSVYVSVDARGNAIPNGVIFTYEPLNIQPTPAPVSTWYLPVYYRDNMNQIIASEYREVRQGTQLISADISRLPAEYYLTSPADVVVSVSYDGIISPREVFFEVARTAAVQTPVPGPVVFSVPVSYQDEQGNVLHTTSQTIQVGYTTVTANDGLVPAGYTLTSSRSVVVYCSSQGITFPSTVVFTYRPAINASIQIVYRDNANNSLHSETRQLGQGSHTITADDSLVPQGYTLQGSRSVQVTVYQNGSVSQNQVVFTYARPVSVTIDVIYRDANGQNLFTERRTLAQGTTTITADDSRVPSGYILQNERNVQVTVYSNGSASHDRVVFLYAVPATARVRIIYRDNNGAELHSLTRTLNQGTTTVRADDSLVPSGYVLRSDREVRVTVRADGTASPSQVVFTYAPPAPPVTVNVPVYYKEYEGNVFYETSVSVSSNSPKTIKADNAHAPRGWVLTSASSVKVTVSPDGVANPSRVIFVYRDPSTITEATMLPEFKTFSFSGGAQPVFSGPGQDYWRASNGKASVQGGRLRVWGTVGDWALIGYGLSNNLYRIGYIKKQALPNNLEVPELFLGSEQVTTVNVTPVNDDPIIQPVKIFELKKGTQVTLLAYLDDRWAYIETTYEDQLIRGFVRRHNISKP